ncbi:MAG: hypothetical protein HYY02_05325 [Chloroflexi bacterium]|nr:hypothetical protein [Chloroflexota bacterium]
MGLQFPAFWWGGGGGEPRTPAFSLVHLLQGGLLSPQVAALLWALLVRRASFLVVGGHYQGAGKTTTLSALTGLFPADTELVFTRGPREDFAFLEQTGPRRTYIMVNEFSDHTPWYLWGQKAARVLRLTTEGYAVAGTMHAESVEEVIQQLEEPPVAVPRSDLARSLQLLVMQAAFQTATGVARRVTALYWLQPAARGPGGLGLKSLAVWEPSQDRWHLFSSPETWEDLARWAERDAPSLQEETVHREGFLRELTTRSAADFDSVRETLLAYPTQRSPAA